MNEPAHGGRTHLVEVETTVDAELARLRRIVVDRDANAIVRRAALGRFATLVIADASRHDATWLDPHARFVLDRASELGAGTPLYLLVAHLPNVARDHADRLDQAIGRLGTSSIPELAQCSRDLFLRQPREVRVSLRTAGLAPRNAPFFYDELESGAITDEAALHDALVESATRGDRENTEQAATALESLGTNDADAGLAMLALRADRLDLLADTFAFRIESRGSCYDLRDVTRVFAAADAQGVDFADLAFASLLGETRRVHAALAGARTSADPLIVETARRIENGPRPTEDAARASTPTCPGVEVDVQRRLQVVNASTGTVSIFSAFGAGHLADLAIPRVVECLEAQLGSEALAPLVPYLATDLETIEGLDALVAAVEADPSLVSPFARAYLAASAHDRIPLRRSPSRGALATIDLLRLARGDTLTPLDPGSPEGSIGRELELATIQLAFSVRDAGDRFAAVAERTTEPTEMLGFAAVAYALGGALDRAQALETRLDARGRFALELALRRSRGDTTDDDAIAVLTEPLPPLPRRMPGVIAPIGRLDPELACELPLPITASGVISQDLYQERSPRLDAARAFFTPPPRDARAIDRLARRDPAGYCRNAMTVLLAYGRVPIPAAAIVRISVPLPTACTAALAAGADVRTEVESAILMRFVRPDAALANAFLALPRRDPSDPLAGSDRNARVHALAAIGRDEESILLRLEAGTNGSFLSVDESVLRNAARLGAWLELADVHDPYLSIALDDFGDAVEQASPEDKAFFAALEDEVAESDDPAALVALLARPLGTYSTDDVAEVARRARTSIAATHRLAERISADPTLATIPRSVRATFGRWPTVRAILDEGDALSLGYVLDALERLGASALVRESCADYEEWQYESEDELPTTLLACTAYFDSRDEEDDYDEGDDYYEEEY